MNRYLFFAIVTASLSGFLAGYQSSVYSIVLIMDAFLIYFKIYTWNGEGKDKFGMPSSGYEMIYRNLDYGEQGATLQGLFSYSNIIGAIIAYCMASFLGNRFGRKKTIMLSAYVFVLGSVIQCFTVHSWIIFCFGKLISGFSIGCISTLCPIYIAEIVPAKRRGKYISYNTLMSCFGSLIGTIITCIIWYYTNVNPKDLGIPRAKVDEPINNFEWRFSFLLQVILGIIVAICLKFLPCSPRWLCLKDRDEEALKVLSKLNGCSSTDDVAVQTELRSIQEEATSSRSTGIGQLFGSVLRRRTFSTILMRLFQQFNGINIILYIQSHIFAEIGFTPFFSKFIEPIFFAIVTLISILPGMWTIDRLGRKNLLTIGSILMIFLHLIS
eukprot:jgi/Orpsp1_1/1187272/evm.model.d7180000056495.1